MNKIKMSVPIVEIDGDEMTRVIWRWVKDILICPYVDLKPNITIFPYRIVTQPTIKSR